MREKWDEKRGDETYGSITIAKALNTVSEIYSSSAHTTKGDAPGWKDQGDRAGVSPDLGCDDETNGGSAAPPEDAAALAFAEQYAGRLLWCQERGRWLAWDSTRWVEDRTVLGMDLCRKFCRELNGKGVRRAQYIAAIERLAKTDRRLAAVPEQFDAHEFEINTPTGIVDLRTGHTITHDSYHYHTKITGVAPFGECPRWLGFLFQITRGDADLQSYLQRVAGYAITGSVREHALFFLYGSGGNGKSTFLDALHYCLGAYAVSAPMNMFTAVQGERHPTDLASLAGAHLVTASETEQGRRWDEVRIKALTGGDPVKARFMHGNFFEYRPTFKLIIAGNNKPQLQSVDEAMRRRLHLVPFTANIPLASRDLDLPAKLREEASGILAWVLEGCRMWQHMGLNPPQCVLDATAEYLATQDSLAAWIEERCVTGAAQWDTPGRLYADWKGYAEKSGENPGTLKVFGDRLEAHGFPRGRTMSYRMHSGLSVKDGDAARAAVLPGSHPWSRQA